jgi:hypothetical protein
VKSAQSPDLEVPETKSGGLSGRRYWVQTALVALGVLLACLFLTDPVAPMYDAAGYQRGSEALLSMLQGGDPDMVKEGLLDLRGVLTPLVYFPAVALAKLSSDPTMAWTLVSVQNSALVALLGAWLLPGLVLPRSRRSLVVILASGLLAVIFFTRFSPYSLMDLPALVLFLLALYGLRSHYSRFPWVLFLLAGLCGGLAFGLRPAYALPLVAMFFWVGIVRHWQIVSFAGGLALAVVPQVWFNHLRWGEAGLLPPGLGQLSSQQSLWASYIVRYDTYLEPGRGGHTFCDSHMAREISVSGPITGQLDLLLFLLSQIPQSIIFVLEKISLVFWWPLSTPYFAPPGLVDSVSGFLTLGVVTIGTYGLARLALIEKGEQRRFAVLLLIVVGAVLVTVVSSAPETRFALPALSLAIGGVLVLLAGLSDFGFSTSRSRDIIGLLPVLVVLAVMILLATSGSSEPFDGAGRLPEQCLLISDAER